MFKTGWKWLFFVYILLVLNFIVIKFNGNIYAVMNTIDMNMSRRTIDGELGINLVPFRTIGTYITDLSFGVALINIVGNIIPFVPMGFLLPMAFPSQRKIMKTLITCFLIIFSIEIIQYVSFLGSFDIDDIILNLFSCLIGYLLFIAYKKGFLIKNRDSYEMKIQIIGGSGTGKSTLAKYISEKEQIKWIDTDDYLWKDATFTENHPIEKRKELYEQDIASGGSYIVSGSVFSWCPEGFRDRDVFIFLSLDEAIRMERLRNREIERNGIQEMWLDENEAYTNDFLEWCKTYWTEEDKRMAGTYAEQSDQMELSASPVLKLDSARPVEELYGEVLKQMLK